MARKKETKEVKEATTSQVEAKWFRVKVNDSIIAMSTRTVFADDDGYVTVDKAELDELRRMLTKG